ncbi:GMP synthase [glutamine-hydrolyzing] [Striga asiatica]|uniref:GMP synthase [glutamine-hydrolyzing] n=1 Tax=Striga asiatica TaxID=4170 RepID=A0A5A7R178_STRAF|nr:GMP synthase [glutamine-hydrolyzing] [Striga asiatica]
MDGTELELAPRAKNYNWISFYCKQIRYALACYRICSNFLPLPSSSNFKERITADHLEQLPGESNPPFVGMGPGGARKKPYLRGSSGDRMKTHPAGYEATSTPSSSPLRNISLGPVLVPGTSAEAIYRSFSYRDESKPLFSRRASKPVKGSM